MPVELPDFGPTPGAMPGVTPELTEETACVQTTLGAQQVARPVDVIFVIDNSGSMTDEIFEIEQQVNINFANIIEAAGIDYRVALLSRYGPNTLSAEGTSAAERVEPGREADVCVAQPLGGAPDSDGDGRCDAFPTAPLNGVNFKHFSTFINSDDGPCRFLEALDGLASGGTTLRQYLRPQAVKIVVFVSDDDIECTATDLDLGGLQLALVSRAPRTSNVAIPFEVALQRVAPELFGAAPDSRNYSIWSIVGQAPYNPTVDDPFGDPAPSNQALAPETPNVCGEDAVNAGRGYQAMSLRTGGYRYPSCSDDYTKMFRLISKGSFLGRMSRVSFKFPTRPPQVISTGRPSKSVISATGFRWTVLDRPA